MTDTIDSILTSLQHFGVHLGLDRIRKLLAGLGNPQQEFPIIHIAGSNGKGSVCAYFSSVLTAAGYRVGCYTSPHLVDWTERICVNGKAIAKTELERILKQVKAAIAVKAESPTQFEVITAAAWLYFAQQSVDIAVIEVGLGGRLDATNVCDKPALTAITSISLEHWQVLGPTVADIAREKAGILKHNCPVVVGQLPPEAEAVVRERIVAVNCPAVWVAPARKMGEHRAEYGGIEYSLSLLGEFQLMNSAIAIAGLQILQQQGWKIPLTAIQAGMANARWLGRLQWTRWQGRSILLDGAHNPAAAIALRQYVNTLDSPVTWVMGILSTKDRADIFAALLRPGDRLYLVPVPNPDSAPPEALAVIARATCPDVVVQTFPDLFSGLNVAIEGDLPVILCGSLYLVGYFLQKHARG
ncbi:folylpolyglutamate synthase/dihydrofolate synthase family protein [Oscillatoria sp. FACHB-1406]|uniref:bifunctional folylpolyglutamate synthase/dihydrofolate synthase n=1 Tax=Oscillatoria sp. FACHB-1406 TaxID=2692846 RepID=UPI001683156F|nr:folylpolyglutamate synthase/dihydrofolate synthase family protein [Oscillatoria sp. FACHB-1406]MBD2576149.1 bifunctional folylpolyglutamate synthase/dihydrofolate synthase [Oscillatoria sp. FACHB-1406]